MSIAQTMAAFNAASNKKKPVEVGHQFLQLQAIPTSARLVINNESKAPKSSGTATGAKPFSVAPTPPSSDRKWVAEKAPRQQSPHRNQQHQHEAHSTTAANKHSNSYRSPRTPRAPTRERTGTRGSHRQYDEVTPSPSRQLHSTDEVYTIVDKSALPFLLGGAPRLGTSPALRGGTAATSRAAAALSSTLPSIPNTARGGATGSRMQSSRTEGGSQTARSTHRHEEHDDHHHHHCGPKCTQCDRIKEDVDQFERNNSLGEYDPSNNGSEGSNHLPSIETTTKIFTSTRKATRNARSKLAKDKIGAPKLLLPDGTRGGGAGPSSGGAAATARRGTVSPSMQQPQALNPIAGMLCGIPLHRVREVYDGIVFENPAIAAQHRGTLLLDEFRVLLRRLVPALDLSDEYVLRMFEPFVVSPALPRRASFNELFSYLAKANGETDVEMNISFFTSCFDEGRGWFPAKLFTHEVVLAFAENRVIGPSLHRWRDVAKALKFDRPNIAALTAQPVNTSGVYGGNSMTASFMDTPRNGNNTTTSAAIAAASQQQHNLPLPGDVKVTIDEVRIAVYSSKRLHEAFKHQPLECVLTDEPRHPLKELQKEPLLPTKRHHNNSESQQGQRRNSNFGGGVRRVGSFMDEVGSDDFVLA